MKKILHIIYNIILWIYMGIEGIILLILSYILYYITYFFDPKRKTVHYLSVYWALHYYWVNPLWKFNWECDEKIEDRPYMIVCNHQSMFDIFTMYKIPLIFKWVSKVEALKIPFVGTLLKMHGDVLIKRGTQQSTKDMLRQCGVWVEKGCSISVFPEGTRSKTGKIGKFKEGAFLVARMNKIPIIPVVIEGTRNVMPPSTMLLGGRATVTARVLPIIDVETVMSKKPVELAEFVHKMIVDEHKKMVPELYIENEND